MSNEITQGDKVRVSKDAPKMYLRGFDHIFTGVESVVSEVEDDNAVIILNTDHINGQTTIPIKYLVKVDAEAKEAEIKCGDKVIAMKTDQITPSSEAETFRRNVSLVTKIKNGIASLFIIDRYNANHYARTAVEFLQKVTDEPTEQTEAEEGSRIRQMEAELDEFRKAELDRMLYPEKYYTYEVTIDNVAMNWQRYEADLAKELAIAYGKRGKSPLDAVIAAKEITKRLKQK